MLCNPKRAEFHYYYTNCSTPACCQSFGQPDMCPHTDNTENCYAVQVHAHAAVRAPSHLYVLPTSTLCRHVYASCSPALLYTAQKNTHFPLPRLLPTQRNLPSHAKRVIVFCCTHRRVLISRGNSPSPAQSAENCQPSLPDCGTNALATATQQCNCTGPVAAWRPCTAGLPDLGWSSCAHRRHTPSAHRAQQCRGMIACIHSDKHTP